MASATPTTARIWQYSDNRGGIENHLKLNSVPIPTPKPNQHLIRVIAVSVNPVDYKPAETPIFGNILVRKPATPGFDLAGEIVAPAAGSSMKPGQLVFGTTGMSPFAGGALAEYVLASKDVIFAVPKGISAIDAASMPICGLTAYQSIQPYVKSGDRVFLNGGSGGVGLCGIQVAKALGCHVIVTCSTKNVEFVKNSGADEVVDYTKGDVAMQLEALGAPVDHVVDNVGHDRDLYWRCAQYTKPGARFVNVASSPTLSDLFFIIRATFFGVRKRKLTGIFTSANDAHVKQILEWMQQGKLRAHIDSRFPMEQAPEAIRKSKAGRARGKIMVDVSSESSS